MVAKISRGSSLFGALSYNQSKVDLEQGKIILSNRILANKYGDIDVSSTMHSFDLHLNNNKQTEKPILHISLNPHPDDVLSDEQLKDIAQEYMDKMGYGNQPFIVYKHEDIERAHIHVVTTNVGADGKKLDSNNDFHRSKKITRELEQKYGLKSAERKTKEEKQAFNFKKIDASKDNVKIGIGNIIKPIAATYKFQSFGEYRTLLAQYNICVEESKGEKNGRKYEGLIYYATNDKGEKISNPFKSSLYGRAVGYKAIHEKCSKNKQTIKDRKLGLQTATRIANITARINDKQKFIDKLKEQNINVVFRENDAGRIYGVTFIDHNNHCVFNGSRLGKEFSANAFNERFSEPTKEVQQPEQMQNNHRMDDDSSFSMGGLLDLPTDSGDDPEEMRFRNRMQKKKRKGRKI